MATAIRRPSGDRRGCAYAAGLLRQNRRPSRAIRRATSARDGQRRCDAECRRASPMRIRRTPRCPRGRPRGAREEAPASPARFPDERVERHGHEAAGIRIEKVAGLRHVLRAGATAARLAERAHLLAPERQDREVPAAIGRHAEEHVAVRERAAGRRAAARRPRHPRSSAVRASYRRPGTRHKPPGVADVANTIVSSAPHVALQTRRASRRS